MKRLLALLLVLFLLAAGCQPVGTATPVPATSTPASSPLSTPWDDRSLFEAGLVSSSRPVLAALKGASVYHLEYRIDPDLIHVTGREEVRYTNQENAPLTDVRFRLFPNILGGELHVPEVSIDGTPVTPTYSLSDSLLIVPLASPLQPGKSTTLAMDFSVVVPDTVDLNYGVFAYADGVLTLAHSYPMIPVFNEQGWNAEIPPQSGDLTFSDMAFFLVTVTAPRDLTLVAVGREVDRQETRDSQIVTYAGGPVRDFYVVAGKDQSVVSQDLGETRINFYAPAAKQAGPQHERQHGVEMVLAGAWNKVAVVERKAQAGLAVLEEQALDGDGVGLVAFQKFADSSVGAHRVEIRVRPRLEDARDHARDPRRGERMPLEVPLARQPGERPRSLLRRRRRRPSPPSTSALRSSSSPAAQRASSSSRRPRTRSRRGWRGTSTCSATMSRCSPPARVGWLRRLVSFPSLTTPTISIVSLS